MRDQIAKWPHNGGKRVTEHNTFVTVSQRLLGMFLVFALLLLGTQPVQARGNPAEPYAYKACKHKVTNYSMAMKRGNPAGVHFYWVNDFLIYTHDIFYRQVTQAIYAHCPRKGPDKIMFLQFVECGYFYGTWQDHKHFDSATVNLKISKVEGNGGVVNNPSAHDIVDNGQVQQCTHQNVRPVDRRWVSQAKVPVVNGTVHLHLKHLPDQTQHYGFHRPSIHRDLQVSGRYRQNPPRL